CGGPPPNAALTPFPMFSFFKKKPRPEESVAPQPAGVPEEPAIEEAAKNVAEKVVEVIAETPSPAVSAPEISEAIEEAAEEIVPAETPAEQKRSWMARLK